MPYYLGIDGGGTKTTCAVGDDSRTLATAIAGASNIVRVGPAETRTSLLNAVRQACAAAGITPDQVARTCVGGSGAGRPDLAETVRGFLAEILPGPIDVVGDMQVALEAAFDTGPGVLVIAGTGSIAYGRNSKGETLRVGGWGFAVGDEGSAHWIGRSAIALALRDSERSPNRTGATLAPALLKAWGVTSLLDLARAASSIPPPDFAALFPAVASSDDKLAQEVLASAGKELAEIASVVIRRLFPLEQPEPVHVAMTGGVFRHAPLVREAFYNELRRSDVRIELRAEVVEPVEGALRMARRAATER